MTLRGNFLTLLLIIVGIGIFCVLLPFLAWKGIVSSDVVKVLVPAIISWPVAALVIALIFFTRFQAAFDYFLRNISTVKIPGVELQTQPPATAGAVKPPEENVMKLTPEQQNKLNNFIQGLANAHDLATTEKDRYQQLCSDAMLQGLFWKFNYLNLLFVPTTKQVLLWFSKTATPLPRQEFHDKWKTSIFDFGQRDTILNLLVQYGMLQESGTRLSLTPEGYSFLQFIGYIPYAPVEAASQQE